MKKLFLAIAIIGALALIASNALAYTLGGESSASKGPNRSYTYHVFNNGTTVNNSSYTSPVYDITGWNKAVIHAKGKTALGNMSSLTATGSTVQTQQAPTASGPWNAFETNTGITTIRRDRCTTINKEGNFLRFIWTKVRQGVDLWFSVE